jgi:hypothetical protein
LLQRAIFAKFGGQVDTIYDFEAYQQWVKDNGVVMGDLSDEDQDKGMYEIHHPAQDIVTD